MKDDDDGNPFTGIIEPENPLNAAIIGYDASLGTSPFFLKDPHSAEHFDWVALCDYCDYSEGGRRGIARVTTRTGPSWRTCR